MKINDLQHGQTVKYRKGLSWHTSKTGGVNWEEWKTGTLHVQRSLGNNKKPARVTIVAIINEPGDFSPEYDYNRPCDFSDAGGQNHPWGYFMQCDGDLNLEIEGLEP